MGQPVTLDLESEISAAKVRLGYRPDDLPPATDIAGALPDSLRAPFWALMVEQRLAELEAEAGIGAMAT
jgi:hypothetical protein